MARMRILITGITGFVGSHLTEWALSRGADVIGALRWRSNTEHIEHLRDRLTLIQSELRELSSARDLVERARPDYIVHRSEEHTSELQSRLHLVCRLLLEKKKESAKYDK